MSPVSAWLTSWRHAQALKVHLLLGLSPMSWFPGGRDGMWSYQRPQCPASGLAPIISLEGFLIWTNLWKTRGPQGTCLREAGYIHPLTKKIGRTPLFKIWVDFHILSRENSLKVSPGRVVGALRALSLTLSSLFFMVSHGPLHMPVPAALNVVSCLPP